MNEQNNIAVIQQAFACFGQGDVPGILNTLSDDVRWWVAPVANVPFTGTRHGHAGAAEFFSLMAECEDVLQFEPRDFIAQGDQVVVRGQYAGRVKATGREYSTYFIHIFTLRDGKVTGFDEYTDTAAIEKAFTKAQTP
ncbi:MAG TPA: nuclear transport factor 2 family protein [Blastocatellia bacterium]|nr:nuclear transport factor 2 family protein [Blastocatellia bacterium]